MAKSNSKFMVRAGLAVTGCALTFVCCWAWLREVGAWSSFVYTMHFLAPYHSSLGHIVWTRLIYNAFSPVPYFLLAWVVVGIFKQFEGPDRSVEEKTERLILVGAVLLGLLSHLLQMKGFPYHRYPF